MNQLATDGPHRDQLWAAVYSYGHNFLHLGGKRLAEYADAYADIFEENGVLLSFDVFYEMWESGAFFGTADGNWHVATERYVA